MNDQPGQKVKDYIGQLVDENVNKRLEEIRKKEAKDAVVAQKKGKDGQTSDERELVKKWWLAIKSQRFEEMQRVNDLIEADYKERGIEYEEKAQAEGTIGSGTTGGILVPTTVADSIVNKMFYISPMRQIGTVINNMPAQLQLPSENSLAQAYWVAEGAPVTESGEVFDPNMLVPFKAAGLDSFTSEVIADAAINPSIQNYVENRFAVALALLENAAFVNGDGSGKPYGFRSSVITPNSVAMGADTLQYTDVTALKYSLKTAYRQMAVFLASSTSQQALENVRDNQGRPIWREGLANDTPPTLLGRPAYVIDEIPSNLGASGAASEIWYALAKNMFIGDRGALRVDYGTNASDFANDKISLRMLRRVAGRPVIGESWSKLTGVL